MKTIHPISKPSEFHIQLQIRVQYLKRKISLKSSQEGKQPPSTNLVALPHSPKPEVQVLLSNPRSVHSQTLNTVIFILHSLEEELELDPR